MNKSDEGIIVEFISIGNSVKVTAFDTESLTEVSIVAEDHRAEHDLFGQHVGLGLDHQHRGFGASDHQVQARLGQLRLARVQHVFAVDVAHALSQ